MRIADAVFKTGMVVLGSKTDAELAILAERFLSSLQQTIADNAKFAVLSASIGRWNATRPLQLVVSDMTMFKVGNTYWEWTILLDTFNNEILAHSVTSQAGNNKPYYHCLDELKKRMNKREEQTSQVVLHTDQGAVCSSRAFCQAHHDYNILRSMSRGGTPTDNPIIEALTAGLRRNSVLTSV